VNAKVRARFIIKTQTVIWHVKFFINQWCNLSSSFFTSFSNASIIKQFNFEQEGRKMVLTVSKDANFFPFKFYNDRNKW